MRFLILFIAMFALSMPALATNKGNSTGVGVGVGVGVGIAGAEANASVESTNKNYNTNKNTNINHNSNHQGQLQGQIQGQQQGQTQIATGGNATATGGSLNVGDTTLVTGPSTSSATGGSLNVSEGAVQNTNNNTAMGGAGGSVNVGEGAIQNTNTGTNTLNVAEGAVTATGLGGAGGTGGSVNIEEGAVNNSSNANATGGSIAEGAVTVNNNFGGENGEGSLATQNVEGSTQIVEGSSTEVNVDARTDFRGAPVASVAPVFSTACSGGMSFQARELGISVGDAEHYCKLLQLADARFAQAQTIILTPPTPPVLADCTGNVPDYTKGSRTDNEMAKEATASCFRQNEAAMADYQEVVMAYNAASQQRTELLNQAYLLVSDAEDYVRSQQLTTNIGEQSRKLMYPVLLIKAVAILFF